MAICGKRNVVLNEDGFLDELNRFELKRRGELKFSKTFQQQVFMCFLDRGVLEEYYDSVRNAANYWLDVLDARGDSFDIEEDRFSKAIQKIITISTGKRMLLFYFYMY